LDFALSYPCELIQAKTLPASEREDRQRYLTGGGRGGRQFNDNKSMFFFIYSCSILSYLLILLVSKNVAETVVFIGLHILSRYGSDDKKYVLGQSESSDLSSSLIVASI
jgi:hypothetical protein